MEIKSIPKDYIINMSKEAHGKVESNFLLHGLKIKNDTDKPMILRQIDMELYAADTFVKQISYRDKSLNHAVEKFAQECTWLGEGFGAQLFLGEEGFWNPKDYSSTITLMPNQETGLFNEYFVVVYHEIIDLLTIHVLYEMEGKEYKQELSITLMNYKNKNKYIFPVEGGISTCGNYNSLLDHRQHYSMEFAIDMATGLSNCPHLHFQLMDKPNILTGRGLPCSFTNINDVTGDPIDRIMEDNIIVHTY